MKTKFLLPSQYKVLGWVLFISGMAFGSLSFSKEFNEPTWLEFKVPDFFDQSFLGDSATQDAEGIKWQNNNLSDEISFTFIILGALLLMLARQKDEDELIMRLRLESLLWAAMVNGVLILLATWLVYDLAFFSVMLIYMPLYYLLFILRFQFALWRFKTQAHEK